jgi:GntR family transcriptional regulator
MNSSSPTAVPLGSPLYEQVKNAMLSALAHGEWKQGEAIPPEKVLAERFGVSIGTLRKAVDELAADNILVRHQGRGTFVALHTRNHHFFKFFRIVRNDGDKSYPTQQLARFRRVRAAPLIREKLGLATSAHVFEYRNVLSLHGRVVMVDDISLPEALFPGLTEQMLRQRPSTLYALYQDSFGINVIGTDERLRTCRADESQAQWLGVAPGEPLLQIRRVAYSYHRLAVEWRVSHLNTESYEYLGQEYQGGT